MLRSGPLDRDVGTTDWLRFTYDVEIGSATLLLMTRSRYNGAMHAVGRRNGYRVLFELMRQRAAPPEWGGCTVSGASPQHLCCRVQID
eukprot:COSAG01_NODE_286_length_19421_cov_123.895663_29_plen_88_part_00